MAAESQITDVLIVDNLSGDARDLAQELRIDGFSVDVHSVEQDAIETMKSKEFKVVMLAINSPDRRGQQFYAAFSEKHGSVWRLPVLIISGLPSLKRRWYESLPDGGAGIWVEINKPYERGEVTSMINRILKTINEST